MGGRGSSSGFSVDDFGNPKNKYGSQYHTIFKSGNIKFVTKNRRNSETLMETMTKGRVYVTVGGDELLQVIYFDTKNKRTKTIDLSHPHFGEKPHVHHGLNSPPFVRQYDILFNKWGVLLCQKEYQTNDIRRSSREWL